MMRSYFSFSHLAAGFISVMLALTGSGILMFEAAASAQGASPDELSSWLFSLSISIACTCIGLSTYYKMPILTGWSTSGAALLITSLSGVPLADAIGAFIVSALLTILTGITGVFEKLMKHIPASLTSAMLAGILLHFGMNVFISMQDDWLMVCIILITYLLGKRWLARYVILLMLLVGIMMTGASGLFELHPIQLTLPALIFTMPHFCLSSIISIGLPLFLVTAATQNLPGLALIKNSGYSPPTSSIITWSGLTNLVLAPWGCFSVNLAAISAGICTGVDADPNPATRYRATVFAGLCWLLIAAFGSTVITLFAAIPKTLILSIAGLSLIITLNSNLAHALQHEHHREAALITLLITASNMNLFGIGSAFWGIIAGSLSFMILNWRNSSQAIQFRPAN